MKKNVLNASDGILLVNTSNGSVFVIFVGVQNGSVQFCRSPFSIENIFAKAFCITFSGRIFFINKNSYKLEELSKMRHCFDNRVFSFSLIKPLYV
jgi:hypothetical protein